MVTKYNERLNQHRKFHKFNIYYDTLYKIMEHYYTPFFIPQHLPTSWRNGISLQIKSKASGVWTSLIRDFCLDNRTIHKQKVYQTSFQIGSQLPLKGNRTPTVEVYRQYEIHIQWFQKALEKKSNYKSLHRNIQQKFRRNLQD